MYPIIYFNLIKSEFVVFETRSNIKIKIRVHSTDLMALTHVWLIEEYSFTAFKFCDNDIIIDVGAHIGLFSLFASQFCKSGKILCFEPIKENYDLLVENIKLNNLTHVIPYNKAVSKSDSTIKIFLNNDESGHSMFAENNNNFVEVPSISLKEIFSSNDLVTCNFLKLDCEGAEYEIIKSLESIDFKHIEKMVIEYHLADTQPQLLKELKKNLQKFSYRITIKPLFSDIGFLYASK